ncbi:MAG: sigma-70 family RNA polymerase sigma factor [Acidobacteriota bacterium]
MKKLVSRAQRGDVEAFQQLYQQYSKKILNYIYRLTGSRAEAEDLTQDTFILAYKNLKALKESNKFQSWLFRIAQNSVYQKYRVKRPPMSPLPEDGSESAAVNPLTTSSKSPEDSLLSSELERFIEKVIDQLPDKQKGVFVLSAIHKLSYKDISAIEDRSLASVKSDVHRARVDVRDKVKEYLRKKHGLPNVH